KVVNECGVNDAVGLGGAGAQAFDVGEVAAMDLCARGLHCLGSRVGAGKAEDLMAGVDEVCDHRRTDETGSSCYENAHGDSPPWAVDEPDRRMYRTKVRRDARNDLCERVRIVFAIIQSLWIRFPMCCRC